MNNIQVAVYIPNKIPESFRVYYENVSKYFDTDEINLITFSDPQETPNNIDLIWDIRSGGGGVPPLNFLDTEIPLVITIHGVATMGIPLWDYFKTWKSCIKGYFSNKRKINLWKNFNNSNTHIIAVSEFGKKSIHKHLQTPLEQIFVCLHGVNHELFKRSNESSKKEYFLHISNGEARKNIRRIITAYQNWKDEKKPELLLKVPENIKQEHGSIPGIRYITDRLTDHEIKNLYSSSIGFIFPSLYEGFGLPILEAMASGCPVITSNSNACSEVAGKAAILINPYNITELTHAIISTQYIAPILLNG